jgi:hypothetical protein
MAVRGEGYVKSAALSKLLWPKAKVHERMNSTCEIVLGLAHIHPIAFKVHGVQPPIRRHLSEYARGRAMTQARQTRSVSGDLDSAPTMSSDSMGACW